MRAVPNAGVLNVSPGGGREDTDTRMSVAAGKGSSSVNGGNENVAWDPRRRR